MDETGLGLMSAKSRTQGLHQNDACAAFEAKLHRATRDIIQSEDHLFGWIADSAELIAALESREST